MMPPPLNALWFARFRVLFGLYLTWHFGSLIPWSAELFSNAGLLPDPTLNPLHGLYPNPLVWWDHPLTARLFTIILTLLSLAYTVGWHRRTASLLLWFGATALFHRNNLTANPSLAYISLLLVLSSLISPGESLNPDKTRPDWKIPSMIPLCAWVLLATGYTFSGLTKLESPSWQDGSALLRLMDNPLAREGFLRHAFASLPPVLTTGLTWGSLALELFFLPLCLHPLTRKWAWLAMTGMHLGILLLIDFADLTLGMLMMHAFTFDPRWLGRYSSFTFKFRNSTFISNPPAPSSRTASPLGSPPAKALGISSDASPSISPKTNAILTNPSPSSPPTRNPSTLRSRSRTGRC